jgi:anaerobic selenocysteine-containing dehydrogenase
MQAMETVLFDNAPTADYTTPTSATSRETVAGICGVCPAGCGVNIHLVDGRIERLTPLRDHPLGFVCPRGARAAEIVYSPDRILYPQKRIGARGEGKFEPISWDEAYGMLVGGLRGIAARHGPEAAAIYTGRGNFEFGLCEAFGPTGTSETRHVGNLGQCRALPLRVAEQHRRRGALLCLAGHDRAARLFRRASTRYL